MIEWMIIKNTKRGLYIYLEYVVNFDLDWILDYNLIFSFFDKSILICNKKKKIKKYIKH